MSKLVEIVFAVWLPVADSTVYAANNISVAASKFLPKVSWQPDATLISDFSCRGLKQQAILGTTTGEIYVAIFLNGLDSRPTSLRFDIGNRNSSRLRIKLDSLEFQDGDFQESLGSVPEGLQSSLACKGIDLGDDDTDSSHIYWNRLRRQFNVWSL